MNNLIRWVAFFACTLFASCGGDSGEKVTLENLNVDINISSDGTGVVEIITTVDNAKYFKFFFGESPTETPVEQTFGSIIHTYEEEGTFTITVQAHRSESEFISQSMDVTIDLFIDIPTEGPSSPTSYVGMTSVWSEEFSESNIDDTKWTFEIGNNGGWGNNELEYYQSGNASIVDGNLMIEARSEALNGFSYTSSRMITKSKFDFKYGRVDVRAALPKGQGIWPAIWLLGSNIDAVGWPKCGEIDIMEMIGGDGSGNGRDNKIYGTAHWFGTAYASYGGNTTLSSGIFKDKFHVFSISWDENYIRWYLDDVKYHEILITPAELSEFKENFFLILNVAVGGNWPGSPNGATTFPQRMFVDYVRVFQPL